ncbi:hypothetical protein DAPPUDRAFT_346911 [Daphnia pulex]|uniref:Gustatory receptor n=1 Tax=Daphnia pulex TaxID=6669 RepID=E9FWF1_DAPPU|nr:hypothetical protein DAPPUDRAFT_346911 [Daphnia pulex]|eukprot:EFX87880.1 hypothetical protein DAPPUDRAFT_346911 [Daphnia pulex]
MLVPTRTVSEEAVEKGWLWSVQPLVTWAKWLGIDLSDLSSGGRKKVSRWFVLYSVFVLLISVSLQLPCLSYIINNHKEISVTFTIENSYNSDTFSWNTAMDYVNFAVHSLATHVIFLSVFRARWNLLGETFQNLESFLKFSFFDRIRKASILGLVWIILLHTTLLATNLYHHSEYGSSFLILFCSLVSVFSQVYPITAIVLFSAVCYASSNAHQSIRMELNLLKNTTTDGNYYNRLSTLKRRHALVCETVDHINHCFGFFMGISLSFHFVSMITASFYLFGTDKEPGSVLEIGFACSQICNLSLICYPADLIRLKADSVFRKLIRMQLEMEEPLKSLTNAFAEQTSLFFPQINAAGFYPISRKIIPQIVGTTLSYFFILYQFQSAERSDTSVNAGI